MEDGRVPHFNEEMIDQCMGHGYAAVHSTQADCVPYVLLLAAFSQMSQSTLHFPGSSQ